VVQRGDRRPAGCGDGSVGRLLLGEPARTAKLEVDAERRLQERDERAVQLLHIDVGRDSGHVDLAVDHRIEDPGRRIRSAIIAVNPVAPHVVDDAAPRQTGQRVPVPRAVQAVALFTPGQQIQHLFGRIVTGNTQIAAEEPVAPGALLALIRYEAHADLEDS